ncbi:MAG TPA: hypothetical protein VJZ49_09730 [Syntrophales bacterium]|nr:hypothetical protein [Syntrophales bacterium]
MNGLMLHCGGKAANLAELDLIPMPEATETYQPVSHYHLARKALTVTQDLLNGYVLSSQSYGLARDGAQMFGVLQFRGTNTEMGLSVGFRNSYDHSMVVGFASGASVFVCDNLALSGDIIFMRKHTKKVWDDLEEKMITTCYRASHNYNQIALDAERFKLIEMTEDDGFGHLGVLCGHDVIGPRQFVAARNEWIKPRHEAFQPRNGWSLYNAVTEVLKSSPPQEVMERHVELHDYFKAFAVPQQALPMPAYRSETGDVVLFG